MFPDWLKLIVAFAFVQERVIDVILELQSSIIDSEKMPGFLNEIQANTDHCHSVLRQLHYMQVYIMSLFATIYLW